MKIEKVFCVRCTSQISYKLVIVCGRGGGASVGFLGGGGSVGWGSSHVIIGGGGNPFDYGGYEKSAIGGLIFGGGGV